MNYNRMGKAGLRLSELSFGSWLTFGSDLDVDRARACMQAAFEAGVNFFDTAETYGDGEAESIMGKVLGDFRREDIVVSTKLFWGGTGPNDRGLSAKHVFEGTRRSLERLQLDYVDLLFCHRPDPDTPVEETVRAMDRAVRSGQALYWGTSEWPAERIEDAHQAAAELGCVPPSVEQPEYNLFERERVEREYEPLFERYGLGTTTWSPLCSGLLTGKYKNGVPAGSRLDKVEWLRKSLTKERARAISELDALAKRIGASTAQLAIAWCLKNSNVSSVILGATSVEQLRENLEASAVKERLGKGEMRDIDRIMPRHA